MTAPSLVSLIRMERDAGAPLRTIAADLGLSYACVSKLAKKHGLVTAEELRGGWRKRNPDPRGKNRDPVSPIDPEKAQRITERNRNFWRTA